MTDAKQSVPRFVLLLSALLAAGCAIDPSSGWRYREVLPAGTVRSKHSDTVPAFAYRTIDNVALMVAIRAHNETSVRGGPPYRIQMAFHDASGTSRHVILHSVELAAGSGSRTFPIALAEDGGSNAVRQAIVFPGTVPFKPAPASPTRAEATVVSDYSLNFEPAKRERIMVRIDIEIVGTRGAVRRQFAVEFAPERASNWISSAL